MAAQRIFPLFLSCALLVLTFLQGCVAINQAMGETHESPKPPFEWTELTNSPGATLSIEETSRVEMGKFTGVMYSMRCSGFVPQASIALWRRIGIEYEQLPASMDDSGNVLVYGEKSVMIGGFKLGEALDLVLMTQDSSVRARAKSIPFPIKAGDSSGCRVSIELMSPSGHLFQIYGEGFSPNQELSVTNKFKKDEGVDTITADENGSFQFPVLFGKKDHGMASVTVGSKDCKVKLDYEVGKKALKVQ